MSAHRLRLRYYPGCLAGESAREYDASIRRLATLLEIELDDVDDWNCCGAGIVQKLDRTKGRALARRNLERTEEGETVVSGCPLCVRCLQDAGTDTPVLHILGVLTRPAIRQRLVETIQATGEKRPVGALKVVCCYGTDLVHGAVWGKPESGDVPPPMETLCEIAGATVVKWSSKAPDPGGSRLFTQPEAAFAQLDKLFGDFDASGADAIVTACPHVHFALDAFQYPVGRRANRAIEVPVLHVTELLGFACGLDVSQKWFARHVTSPFPLLDRLYDEEEERKRTETEMPGGAARSPKQ